MHPKFVKALRTMLWVFPLIVLFVVAIQIVSSETPPKWVYFRDSIWVSYLPLTPLPPNPEGW